MSDTVIQVEGLGKRYRLGERRTGYKTIRESLTAAARRGFSALTSRNGYRPPTPDSEFWALRDVSFEVKQGEVVGIIGRNGAGKSTLLKILSRITEPTTGHARIRGRVGSLLEVGTGFHPELTGRENIYLNGAILGMSKAEIDRKFDEIVAFAEVEQFLDTPVKRYSSGMQLRLGFSVAAHLETEILVVDEVLAVGDATFQRKCLGKMTDIADAGRTVLFVSHNMPAVLNLCTNGFVLNSGRVVQRGQAREAVEHYLSLFKDRAPRDLAERLDRRGSQALKFLSYRVLDERKNAIPCVSSGQTVSLSFTYKSTSDKPLRNVHVAVGIHGLYDEHLFHVATNTHAGDFPELPPSGEVRCELPNLPLQPGRYSFNLFCTVNGEIADWIRKAGVIEVEPGDFFGSGRLPPATHGPFLVLHRWAAG